MQPGLTNFIMRCNESLWIFRIELEVAYDCSKNDFIFKDSNYTVSCQLPRCLYNWQYKVIS